MPVWLGFLRVGTYMNVYKAKKEGASGNMEGEGRLLGGLSGKSLDLKVEKKTWL